MSIDALQDKIRKLKNPSMVDFGVQRECIPPHFPEEEGSELAAYCRFCRELMAGLKGIVPAVRFSFGTFGLFGPEGLTALEMLLRQARDAGFYVVLDAPGALTPWDADRTANALLGEDSAYPCDAVVISPYIGSDGVKPFVPYCKAGKDLFVAVRSPNKSAAELQDLMTGSRLVHSAAADMANRFGQSITGRWGYSHIGALASAGAASSLRSLREKYNRMFLLVDGLDYPSGNVKNCCSAFDKFGHGAIVCAGPSVTAAWQTDGADGKDFVSNAVQAAERMKKSITRYITIL